jgi:putative membrane protein
MRMKRMRSAVLGAAVVLMPLALFAQIDPTTNPNPTPMNPQAPQNQNLPLNQPGNPTQTGSQATPQTSMRDSLGAPGMTGQQMMDKQFMRTAAENGIADVKMGTLAVEKGSPGVKELAQKMIDDHTAINRDMGTVADAAGVTLPKKMNKDDETEYQKMNGLSGKDFDTEYVTYIAKSHYEDLHNFHKEAAVAADPELEAEVVKATRTMHDHLGLIAKTADAEGITLPPRPQRPVSATTAKK